MIAAVVYQFNRAVRSRGLRAADTSNRAPAWRPIETPSDRYARHYAASRRGVSVTAGDTTHSGHCLLTLFVGAGKACGRAAGHVCVGGLTVARLAL